MDENCFVSIKILLSYKKWSDDKKLIVILVPSGFMRKIFFYKGKCESGRAAVGQ